MNLNHFHQGFSAFKGGSNNKSLLSIWSNLHPAPLRTRLRCLDLKLSGALTNWSWFEEWVRKDKSGLGKTRLSIFWPECYCSMIKTDLKLMTKERKFNINVRDNFNILFSTLAEPGRQNTIFGRGPKQTKPLAGRVRWTKWWSASADKTREDLGKCLLA